MELVYEDEISLITGLKNRDEYAFEELMNKYGDRLLQLCYLILREYSLAEDVVQEIFIQIYNSIGKFNGNSALYTWIYRISINKCRDVLKKRKEYIPIDEAIALKAEIDIEVEILESFNRKNIKETVFSLSPVYREVVILFYFENLTINEISSIIGENVNTIKSRLFRARNILKEIFFKEGLINEK